jgi:cytochrome c peroxidase
MGGSETFSPNRVELGSNDPFFRDFGTNGRACSTCHQEKLGWTITPQFAQHRALYDPLFAFDGSDCLPAGAVNPNPAMNSTQMLEKALVRITIGIPEGADFTLLSFTDPLQCPTPPGAAGLRMYRRPLPAANTFFLSTVMWDGRENVNPPNNSVGLIQADLEHQANDATRIHAQAAANLNDVTEVTVTSFETNLFNARKRVGDLDLNAGGGNGGAAFLFANTLPNFFIGINDVLSCAIPNLCEPGRTANFSSRIFTVYQQWENDPPSLEAAAIGRGEVLFNTRSFPIDDVPGLNGPRDTLGIPSPFAGFCGSCHDSPNVGNHSTSLPIDIGVTAQFPVGGLDVARLPTYTFEERSTGQTTTVTDPGRGLISGKFKDIGKTKGPSLRGLAVRAPYFHNGSAKDLEAVVDFYNARFHIGFTTEEKADLVAFLQAL